MVRFSSSAVALFLASSGARTAFALTRKKELHPSNNNADFVSGYDPRKQWLNSGQKKSKDELEPKSDDSQKTQRALGRILQNRAERTSSKEECDPLAADIGILGCTRPMEDCQAHEDSSMGGYCLRQTRAVQDRSLEEPGYATLIPTIIDKPPYGNYNGNYENYYGPASYICGNENSYGGYYAQYCDCSEWNAENRSGFISCDFDREYCYYNCRIDTCYNLRVTYNATAEEEPLRTVELCYDFTKPENQTFCLTYGGRGGSFFYYGFSGECEISLNDTACDYCYQSNYCILYDCQNVGSGYNNDCYDYNPNYPQPPLIKTCNEVPPIVGDCPTFCPEGTGVVSPNITISFPFINTPNITCGFLEEFEDEGKLYGPACDYVSSIATDLCCVPIPEEPATTPVNSTTTTTTTTTSSTGT